VSPKIKEPRKQSKKPKKNNSWFFLQKKTKSRSNQKRLLYVTHQKKPIHTPILLCHVDVSRKKNQTQNTEPEIIDCAPPENGSKKQPEPLN